MEMDTSTLRTLMNGASTMGYFAVTLFFPGGVSSLLLRKKAAV